MKDTKLNRKLLIESFKNDKVCVLVERTLAEDFETFKVNRPDELARLTISKIRNAKEDFPAAARTLALDTYQGWTGGAVREKYHHYNWKVERAGSARTAKNFINGTSVLDLGGGPGTFALELLKLFEKGSEPNITIADIDDYRNLEARKNSHISFSHVHPQQKLPFKEEAFDAATLLYVLHHIERDHKTFLQDLARCVKRTLVLFEDVLVNPAREIPKSLISSPRPLEHDFLKLNLFEQSQFIVLIDYVCNHIASQALEMPVPGKYYEFTQLERVLNEIFPKARIEKYFHGIYKEKCYPNPEAMYVVHF